MSDLRQLRERVAGLSRPSSAVDFDIWNMLLHDGKKQVAVGSRYLYGDQYTASIDAALALVERVEPTWKWFHLERESSGWWCELGPSKLTPAPTAPLAILLALLEAKLQDTTP